MNLLHAGLKLPSYVIMSTEVISAHILLYAYAKILQSTFILNSVM